MPFVALPPASGRREGMPVVAAWHLLDAPRTEAAFAAAVPLHGLDAWRIYFGLPMTGARLPAGGPDELMQLAYADAILKLYEPIAFGAASEFSAVLPALCAQLGLEPGPIGVMGGSIGAAVAQLVLAQSDLPIRAAVLLSPVVQLSRVVDAMERQFGVSYAWSDASRAVANRLDFVGRADDLARHSRPAVLLVVGGRDDPAFQEPAAALRDALASRDVVSELVTIPDMGHALADEPGLEPAPQTPHAALVDQHAVRWFQQHL